MPHRHVRQVSAKEVASARQRLRELQAILDASSLDPDETEAAIEKAANEVRAERRKRAGR
jgi:hypothetical protein